MEFTTIFDFIGTFAFAISGIRLASAKQFDWFGAYVVGAATAIGGGTLRDVILDVPVFWMHDGFSLACTAFALLWVIIFRKHLIKMHSTFFIFDAIGLALFTIVGNVAGIDALKVLNFGAFSVLVEGGIGLHTTGITKRRFLPNLQTVRTTDGKGKTESLTFAEICKLRLQACSEVVPTAEEVFEVLRGRDDVFIEIEMKAYPSDFYTDEVLEDYCRKLTAAAKAILLPGTYAFTCFNVTTLETMRRVDALAPIGYIMGGALTEEHIATAKRLKCCSVAPSGCKTSKEMIEALYEPITAILDSICLVIEQTPPELSADIYDFGIMLSGGGALLRGIDKLISERTGIQVKIAPRPLESVCMGILRVIESEGKLGNLLQYRGR